jgi:hypothetical protein
LKQARQAASTPAALTERQQRIRHLASSAALTNQPQVNLR